MLVLVLVRGSSGVGEGGDGGAVRVRVAVLDLVRVAMVLIVAYYSGVVRWTMGVHWCIGGLGKRESKYLGGGGESDYGSLGVGEGKEND